MNTFSSLLMEFKASNKDVTLHQCRMKPFK